MRVFTVAGAQVQELPALPEALPAQGFVWIACSRTGFAQNQAPLQRTLEHLCGHTLVDLHVSDLLNPQLPSRFDY
ncbi:MAG: magnesium transporter CorA, partial [Limnohabitans sp.]